MYKTRIFFIYLRIIFFFCVYAMCDLVSLPPNRLFVRLILFISSYIFFILINKWFFIAHWHKSHRTIQDEFCLFRTLFFSFFFSISFRCLSVNEDKEGIIDSIPTVKHRHYHQQFDRIILYLFYARLRIVENPWKSHVYHATIASHNRWIYFIWFDDLIRIITYIVIESMRILIWKMIFFRHVIKKNLWWKWHQETMIIWNDEMPCFIWNNNLNDDMKNRDRVGTKKAIKNLLLCEHSSSGATTMRWIENCDKCW